MEVIAAVMNASIHCVSSPHSCLWSEISTSIHRIFLSAPQVVGFGHGV